MSDSNINDKKTNKKSNVLVVGLFGSGKTSFVNMMNNATTTHTFVETDIGCDFAPCYEGHESDVQQQLKLAKPLLDKLTPSHIIFVWWKGRITGAFDACYTFWKALSPQGAFGLVITHCEDDNPMDQFFENNKKDFKFAFDAHISGTTRKNYETFSGATIDYSQEYSETVKQVMKFIEKK